MEASRFQRAEIGRGKGRADAGMKAAPARRALFVGADQASLQQCRHILEELGFAVDPAESGVAALVAVRKRAPDLIVVERQLRDVAAAEAIGWLRSNPALRSTPVIVLTTGVEDDGDMAAIAPGASLPKWSSLAAMRRTVRRVLKQAVGPSKRIQPELSR
jgi:CheY-like chemotaxis protein